MARVMAPAMARAMAQGIGTRGSQAKPLPLSMVEVVCGVSNTSCIASNGDLYAVAEGTHEPRGGLDVSSCNATNSIEHLDYDHTPPCEAEPGWHDTIPPADWSLHISAPCGHRLEPTFALLCDGCRQWYVDHPKAAGCGRCLGPVRLRFEPLR